METTLGLQDLHVHEIEALLSEPLRLHPEAIQRIEHCREYLDRKMEESDRLYYGINTGFGSLCNIRIPKEHIGLLQHNLVVSHACGLGAEVPQEIVRIMLLLKIKNFTYGHSGVSMTLVQRLVDMYNQRAHPVVYELGSLGASGDLAPLAHLSLPLLGEGEVWMGTERLTGAALNQRMKWPVLELQSKEGLALLNGTQFMNAYAIASLLHTHRLLQWADAIAALSFDAFDCTLQPFSASIHRVRAHRGQVNVAQNMQQWLQNSELAVQPKSQVQDPYSFRCIPQVHGASRDAADAVTRVVEQELNSVTDNPMIFPEEDSIVSGGNFHGQPLAIHLDFLAIAVAELASISERRTYLLISGQRN
ncbi:MAG TPA: aromatic amino acid ammonia-lyase [Chitinophagaceae bacterium]|nr:aromatic amino acid ammonia-lyase [Chitinophagaceae bacterium]